MFDKTIQELKAPFAPEKISWRIQGKPYEKDGKWSGRALAYIDARDVMNRLDDVVGAENWSVHYQDAGKRVFATLAIKIDGEWIAKTDAAGDTDVEAEKGAVSDALKRAAVVWGVGRYLYDLDAPWVECKVRDNKGAMQWMGWVGDPWKGITIKAYSSLWSAGFANSAARNEYYRLAELAIEGAETSEELQKFKIVVDRLGKTDPQVADNINKIYEAKRTEFDTINQHKQQLGE